MKVKGINAFIVEKSKNNFTVSLLHMQLAILHIQSASNCVVLLEVFI